MLLFNFKYVILVAHPTGVLGVGKGVFIQALLSCWALRQAQGPHSFNTCLQKSITHYAGNTP